MRMLHRQLMQALLRTSLLLPFLELSSYAFGPMGGNSTFDLGIRFLRWDFGDLDQNGDGDVSGPDDGIAFTLESGEFGFTPAEMNIIKESFQTWEDVPSAYAGFKFTTPSDDPAGVGADASFFAVDGLRFVAAQVDNDPVQDGAVGAILGLTLVDFLIEDGQFTTPEGDVAFFVEGGGRIYEADIVINAGAHRSPGNGIPPLADLKGTMVHEIGHALGIDHTPLNNLDVVLDEDGEIINVLENQVVGMRDAQGRLALHGATPTMFPFAFSVLDEDGQIQLDGGVDLAWDDVVAVSFLYPRTNQSNFFNQSSFARSQSTSGFPSFPILGGLVTTWVDTDNSPNTPRIPLTSTLTGLYTYREDIFARGDFTLPNLPKEIEHPAIAGPFNPTYTFTIDPVRGDEFPFQSAINFDSTHTQRTQDQWTGVSYTSFFPSQTYLEDSELFGSDNHDAGTAFVYDQQRERFVSVESGRTLDRILRRGQPMFGDADQICPLDVIEQAVVLPVLPNMLRGFRDGVLLDSAIGALAVDTYYQAAPFLARTLAANRVVRSVAVSIAIAAEWVLTRDWMIFALLGAITLSAVRLRFRRAAVAGSIALATVFVVSGESSARVLFLNDKQLTAQSDAIIEGHVSATEPRLRTEGRGVSTDTTIVVQDTLKGRENKGSTIFLSMPGGRVGDLQTSASELPRFEDGEDIILFLTFIENYGYVVTGGYQGKVTITANKDTGGAEVQGRRMVTNKSGNIQSEGMVPLETYKERIRGYVEQQKEASSGDAKK